MAKLNTTPRLAVDAALLRELREHAQQVNKLSEGVLNATYNATDSVPTHDAAPGDFVKKLTRSVAGTAGSRYVLDGWERVGTVWVERRFLTGT